MPDFNIGDKMKVMSICIPTYEMGGNGDIFLKFSFDILTTQTFNDFDIIISDHSKNDLIKDLCERYQEKLDIKYYRNTRCIGNSSANLNNAIGKAQGKLIKILFQDDFLYSSDSLEIIVKNFNPEEDSWLVTACEHTRDGVTFYRPFYPRYNDEIFLGNNTISSPSVLTIKNENHLLFDENLIWLMDCDYYKRCYDTFGEPRILNTITVVNRISEYQVSSTRVNKTLKDKEFQYMLKKYDKKTVKNIISGTLSVLRENMFQKLNPFAKRKISRSQLINMLIKKNNYKKYLEIGVNTPAQPGYNYDNVEIELKHGVDPAVDTTYTMTSDEFFEKHVTMKYDLIFVDGLHIFEQAYRDIINSLKWLNEKGMIVVHDCNPVTEITQRRERASSIWHGDVWKAILKLRMEEPDISIYTVDTDEGCAVIKKGSQELFSIKDNDVDVYTYNFFNANRKKILNLISVEEFLTDMNNKKK